MNIRESRSEQNREPYDTSTETGAAKIWIGTSGWVYPHWIGNFYPAQLPAQEQLVFYALTFPTVEINYSFYRLPTFEQFQAWAHQVAFHSGFRFAVKASRYLTHMKKLANAESGIQRLLSATSGLGERCGPMLYQLPPHWHVNLPRLAQFVQQLPVPQPMAFEFRDPTWLAADSLAALPALYANRTWALVVGVGGPLPTPPELLRMGSFCYVRFHNGSTGTSLTEAELQTWAERLADAVNTGRTTYAFFNNDPEGYAIRNALRLRELLTALHAPLAK